MKQNRNFHVLENDLKDEMPLFENVESAFEILKNLKLKKDLKIIYKIYINLMSI